MATVAVLCDSSSIFMAVENKDFLVETVVVTE